MHVNEVSRQKFSKIASRGFQGRMTLTAQELVLGAGTLLGKLDDKALLSEADQERIWTLLSVAYGHEVPLAVSGSLRRVAKHWHGGDKSLAAIRLAQTGLPDIGEDAAYRLSLVAELIDAGVAPRELAQELGLNPVQFDVSKYDENQPRVPAGSGRESGQWTSNGAGTGTQTEHRLTPTAPAPVQVAQDAKCSVFISENCKGSILREFPSEYLDLSVDQLLKDAQAGVPTAKNGKNLLFDNRFRK